MKENDVVEQNVYVLYDCVAERSSPCFEAVNDRTALRLVEAQQVVKMAPRDYVLYCIGARTRGGHWVNADARSVPFSAELLEIKNG